MYRKNCLKIEESHKDKMIAAKTGFTLLLCIYGHFHVALAQMLTADETLANERRRLGNLPFC